MALLKKRSNLYSLVFFGLIFFGCGAKPEGEVVVENFDTPPQVTITLHSQLELDFPLEPDLQPQMVDAEASEDATNKKIDTLYAELKNKRGNRSQLGQLPDYKANNKYQSLKRYETIDTDLYTITFKKSPEKFSSRIRETVKVQDKPLIFAGRGYNINAFEKEIKPAIDVDYTTHLVVIPPEPPAGEIKDQMDLKAEYSKDIKFLVYNSTRSAFGEFPPALVENKIASQPKAEPVILLERNPDSVLLFPRGEKSLMVLRQAEKQFDLLSGNESLNKKQFKSSSAKDFETSNKTPSTLQ
jgi:hypothetical protein